MTDQLGLHSVMRTFQMKWALLDDLGSSPLRANLKENLRNSLDMSSLKFSLGWSLHDTYAFRQWDAK